MLSNGRSNVISEIEIIEAGANVFIIEDYPTDKYSPSCLLLGITIVNRVLHIQVSRIKSDLLKITALPAVMRYNNSN
jgi:hypothetical protein